MTPAELKALIAQGESTVLEFKRCGNEPGSDVFETICSFANRQGGDLLLGILDDGTIEGVNPDRILPIRRSIINAINNPEIFNVPPAIEMESIEADGRMVIRAWVPLGANVYRYKSAAYDRMDDVDVRLKSDMQLSNLYLRKRDVFSERKIYPHLRSSDLRLDLIPHVKRLAASQRSDHPWLDMGDEELLHSAGLYARDLETGQEGYTRAAILLLGTDEAIMAVAPAYRTDVIVRTSVAERYDDRLTVATNLVESYEQLLAFMQKHLPDRFFLQDTQRVSIRDIICRELIANSLIHREYSSTLPAQIVIGPDGVHTANASRSFFSGRITPDNLYPRPKNPLIEKFFAQIGRAEELGSGTRTLFTYAPIYSNGGMPVLEEGDIFKAFVPTTSEKAHNEKRVRGNADKRSGGSVDKQPCGSADSSFDGVHGSASDGTADNRYRPIEDVIAELLDCDQGVTVETIINVSGMSRRTVNRHLAKLVDEGKVEPRGATRNRYYVRGTEAPNMSHDQ